MRAFGSLEFRRSFCHRRQGPTIRTFEELCTNAIDEKTTFLLLFFNLLGLFLYTLFLINKKFGVQVW